MRGLLLLSLLLYSVITALTSRDYEELDGRRGGGGGGGGGGEGGGGVQSDRKFWRKKALQTPMDLGRGREDGKYARYDEKPRDVSLPASYPKHSPYTDYKGKEEMAYYDKEIDDRKLPPVNERREEELPMDCDRDRERYENCFAGCAAVSCDNPRERPRPCYPFCEAGCVCAPPYVRDDRTHKCVLPEECTKGLKGIPDLGETDGA